VIADSAASLAAAQIALDRHPGAVHQRPGGEVLRRRPARALDLGTPQRRLQRRHDRLGHLVVDFDDLLELAVEALRPGGPTARGVDELGRHPDPVASLANASLEHVAHAELA
jgi:hypothetical protein